MADLNGRARELLTARGELGEELLDAGGLRFAVGDEVLALRNDYRLGVLNGTRGTVASATKDVVARPGAIESGQERVVPEFGPEARQFSRDDGVAQEHRRQGGLGGGGRHPLHVAAEDLLFHRPGVEEVDGYEQEALSGQRGLVPFQRGMQLDLGAGCRVPLQEQGRP